MRHCSVAVIWICASFGSLALLFPLAIHEVQVVFRMSRPASPVHHCSHRHLAEKLGTSMVVDLVLVGPYRL